MLSDLAPRLHALADSLESRYGRNPDADLVRATAHEIVLHLSEQPTPPVVQTEGPAPKPPARRTAKNPT